METVVDDRCVPLWVVFTLERFTFLLLETAPDFMVLFVPRLPDGLCTVIPDEVLSLPDTLVLFPEDEFAAFLPDSMDADLRATVP